VKASEFSEVANLLIGIGGVLREGRERSAVSRYYYAAFLEARDKLSAARGASFRREAHEKVRRAYAWAEDTQLRRLGQYLEQLKKLREEADYDIAQPADSLAAQEARSLYEAFVKGIGSADVRRCRDPDS
jgi:uncharacterized protein (UPF0332 family)